MSLYQEIYNRNLNNLNGVALYYENKKILFHDFFANIRKMINYFKTLNINKGDIITISLPNIPINVYAFYALNEIGAIQNIIHPLTKIEQIIESMKLTNSKYGIVLMHEYFNNNKKGLSNLIYVNPFNDFIMNNIYSLKYKKDKNILLLNDFIKYKENTDLFNNDDSLTSIYLHSGGTTGVPKIIELSNDSINNLAKKVPYIVNKSLKGKSMLAVLPTFHGFGLGMGIHAPLFNQASSALMMKFNSNLVIKWINQNKVNLIIGVPLLYQKLILNKNFQKAKLSNLEFCFIGGDIVQTKLINDFNDIMISKHSNCRLLEGYGLTETVTVCAVNTLENYKIGSVGKPLKDIDVLVYEDKILERNEIGEICINSNTMMNGYLNDLIASNDIKIKINEKLYIKSGDLGYIDNEGYIYIKGRKKRVFKISGINVYPLEIEKIVLENNDIFDATMEYFANPKPHTNLYIILNKNYKGNQNELISLIYKTLNERLIKYMIPNKIIVLDEFPKTKIGKIDHDKFLDE